MVRTETNVELLEMKGIFINTMNSYRKVKIFLTDAPFFLLLKIYNCYKHTTTKVIKLRKISVLKCMSRRVGVLIPTGLYEIQFKLASSEWN